MSRDEIPLSTHPADQAWFAMLLANDPNTALIDALRPSRRHGLWAALRRPFERAAPYFTAAVSEAEIPGLRPRPARWIGAGLLLALGIALAALGLERVGLTPPEAPTASSALPVARLATTTLQVRPAPSPQTAEAITVNVAPPNAQVREEAPVTLPRPALPSASATSSAKKKPAARPTQREIRPALKKRRTAR